MLIGLRQDWLQKVINRIQVLIILNSFPPVARLNTIHMIATQKIRKIHQICGSEVILS